MLVTVENNEIEVVDLLREQLARREGDKRKLIDRRTVVFLGRPQNREVDQIDGGVLLQEVSPGALASVRFTGNEQHAQILAHSFCCDDGAVVGGRELAGRRVELDLEDILARVRERHVDRDGTANGGGNVFVGAALLPERPCVRKQSRAMEFPVYRIVDRRQRPLPEPRLRLDIARHLTSVRGGSE